MSHILDEINAAIKLGDRFYPPKGTVCLVRIDDQWAKVFPCRYFEVVLDYDPTWVNKGWIWAQFVDSRDEGWITIDDICRGFMVSSIGRIVFVPAMAPVFSLWIRPPPSEWVGR